MIRRGIIFAGFAASLAVTPAMACSPAELVPMAGVQRGAGCEASWNASPYDMAQVSKARVLAPGFVIQTMTVGNGCMGSRSFVVHDCARSESLVIGGAGYDLYAPEADRKDTALEGRLSRAAGRKNTDLAALRRLASRHGANDFQLVAQGATIDLGGRKVSFECGCKTLFPAKAPENGGAL
ncbi:hypothetical protein HOY34_08545 [Xinfangfangia sp. D13-10-4-6]|uniref:hypothetical protein n=1 Tax=Pseudogemmobacter hezensis TaxID=2737662 RepID=UPI001553A58D|nr:hypothetical protein [Pseudogemmobacter hezensis]NPD15246.1 hypothetical protein [Pseudogemmobacter hezensis]